MMSFELKYLSKWEKISSLNPLYLIPISSNVNLIRNMTDSNDSLKFDIKYNFIRLQLSEFYLVQKYYLFSIENDTFSITKPVVLKNRYI